MLYKHIRQNKQYKHFTYQALQVIFVSQFFLKQFFVCISNFVSGEKHKLVTNIFIRKCKVISVVFLCYFRRLKLSDVFFKYLFRLYFNSVLFQIRTELEKYFKRNGKRNKVQKSESFLLEKTISTDCILNDDTENVILCR